MSQSNARQRRMLSALLIEDSASKLSTKLGSINLAFYNEDVSLASQIQIYDVTISSVVFHDDLLKIALETLPDLIIFNCYSYDPRWNRLHDQLLKNGHGLRPHFMLIPRERSNVISQALQTAVDEVSTRNIAEIRERIKRTLRLKLRADHLRIMNHKLKMMTLIDDLTGLSNMRAFHQKLALHQNPHPDVAQVGLGFIMIDLDHLKYVNDTSNHLVGSHIIKEVGRLIQSCDLDLSKDCAARFGGDEFIVMLVDKSGQRTTRIAEKIHQAVADHLFEKDGYRFKITASLGCCWRDPSYKGNDEDPIKIADIMLFESKREGRNQISSAKIHTIEDRNKIIAKHKHYQQDSSGILSKKAS